MMIYGLLVHSHCSDPLGAHLRLRGHGSSLGVEVSFAFLVLPFCSGSPFFLKFPGPKLKIIQRITNRAIKICTADCFDLELDSIYNFFIPLGYPETVIKKTIKATQYKMNRYPLSAHILAQSTFPFLIWVKTQ